MTRPARPGNSLAASDENYAAVLEDVARLVEEARQTAARTVNTIMCAVYWTIGKRIVDHEQRGERRAAYGAELIRRLSQDLSRRFGKGFGPVNLSQMRRFYLAWDPARILQTASEKSPGRILQTVSEESPLAVPGLPELSARLRLPWSHYVQLLSVKNTDARTFYEQEALRGGWTVRQLARQIDSQFYERTALSRSKAAMLAKGSTPRAGDAVSADEEVKDPFVLEFLGLKDEYSETDLEDALVRHVEGFLLELGNDFAFVGRQRRLRIDDTWYRVDLVFFHRRLRCLVIIDLKLGRFTHADAGQMHLYLNYAREHWTQEGENPPVGLILCSGKGDALVRYATDNLPNKLLVREYLTVLPDEKLIAAEIEKTRRLLEQRPTVAAPTPSTPRRQPRRGRP